jgi:hypothetical protein
MSKTVEIHRNWAGGFDLLAERDSGNHITILTGKRERSLEFWQEISRIAGYAIDALEYELANEEAAEHESFEKN